MRRPRLRLRLRVAEQPGRGQRSNGREQHCPRFNLRRSPSPPRRRRRRQTNQPTHGPHTHPLPLPAHSVKPVPCSRTPDACPNALRPPLGCRQTCSGSSAARTASQSTFSKPAALLRPNRTSPSYVQGRVCDGRGESSLTLLPAPFQAYKYGNGSYKAMATVRLAESFQHKRDWDGARSLLEEVRMSALSWPSHSRFRSDEQRATVSYQTERLFADLDRGTKNTANGKELQAKGLTRMNCLYAVQALRSGDDAEVDRRLDLVRVSRVGLSSRWSLTARPPFPPDRSTSQAKAVADKYDYKGSQIIAKFARDDIKRQMAQRRQRPPVHA